MSHIALLYSVCQHIRKQLVDAAMGPLVDFGLSCVVKDNPPYLISNAMPGFDSDLPICDNYIKTKLHSLVIHTVF